MLSRLGSALGQVAILVAALVLIALAWIGSFSAITAERDQAEARVEASVGVEATALEQQISRQLLALDQTLRFLRREREANPSGFDLPAWRAQATLLNEIFPGSLFLVDETGKVSGVSGPPAVGLPIDLLPGDPFPDTTPQAIFPPPAPRAASRRRPRSAAISAARSCSARCSRRRRREIA